MKTKYFKLLSVLAALIIAFSCFSFVASADTNYVFNFPIGQPQASENFGYLEILYERPGYGVCCEVLLAQISLPDESYYYDYDADVSISVDFSSISLLFTTSSLQIKALMDSGPYPTFITLYYYSSLGNSGVLSSEYTYNIDYDSILGFHMYGNFTVSSSYVPSSNNNFTCNYGTDSLSLQKLDEILKNLRGDNDPFEVPKVAPSSIDYGFLNFSVPVLESTSGTVLGGASVFAPFLNSKKGYNNPFPYYSFSCAAALKRNSGKFSSNAKYVAALSLNFDKPVEQARFKIYISDAVFKDFTFNSYGSDNLDLWIRKQSDGYAYLQIYNITHPVKFFFTFETLSSLQYGGTVIPFCMSLSELTYLVTDEDELIDDIINGGSDVTQPDFDGTNNELDSVTSQMTEIENEFVVDEEAVASEMSTTSNFIDTPDLAQASAQVSSWYDKFASDNSVYIGFLITVLTLGMSLWIIGRRGSS